MTETPKPQLAFQVKIHDTGDQKEKLIHFAHLLNWLNTITVALAVGETGNDGVGSNLNMQCESRTH